MTEVIRETKLYQLNKGNGMANGLYNVSEKNGNGLSFWFDEEVKEKFMQLSDKEFDKQVKNSLNYNF